MKKALVTGGAGFIGSYLCDYLLDKGNEVVCVDNLITGNKENITQNLKNPQFSFINHDVIIQLPEDINKVDYVFHLASPASPNHHSNLSYHKLPLETMLVNTQGTYHLLKQSKRWNARFLFASTSEIYGDPLKHPQKEDYYGNVSTTGPRSVYDEAKRFGETLTAYFAREKNLDARIVRIFNTYGPRMQKDDKRMIIQFIYQACLNEPITIYGTGKQTRSLCYIDDMIKGLYKAITTENTKGEIINLGNDKEYSIIQYAQLVKKITHSKSSIIISENLPKDDPARRKPDITKANKILDWYPETSLEKGLEYTIKYIKKTYNL